MPKISVIVPVLNREHTLPRLFASIEAQTVKPHEVIVVDNGSIDRSMQVAGDFAARHGDDFCVTLPTCDTPGASAARNAGMATASGDWLVFFDSDDEMLPNLLSTYSQEITKPDFNADIIAVPQYYRFLSGKQKPIRLHCGNEIANQIMHTTLSTNNMAVRATIAAEAGGWDVTLPSWNDWEFGIRLLLSGGRLKVLSDIRPQLIHISQNESITGVGFAHHLEKCLAAIAAAQADLRHYRPRNLRYLNMLLQYKRLMLAAQCRREGDTRAEALRSEVLGGVDDAFIATAYKYVYRHIAAGLPGGATIADLALQLRGIHR